MSFPVWSDSNNKEQKMAATPIQKIPTLTGEKAKRFIERADSSERPALSISEQQRKMYAALSEKNKQK
ncbi:hypothetical protein [Leptospira weilii]|uniref:hypothetical protein n=2 Tax=Leptospiraceae TaxID=170 RepID=UPI000A928513|nr:hypothetical protein [Leptospira weilii]